MFDSWNRSRKHRRQGSLETWIQNRSWIESARRLRQAGSGPKVDTAGQPDASLSDPEALPAMDSTAPAE